MCNINPCFTYFWVPAVSTGNRSVDGPVPDYVPKLAPTGAVLADCCSGAGSNGQAMVKRSPAAASASVGAILRPVTRLDAAHRA